MELEALEAIYAADLGYYCKDYPNIAFRLRVSSEQDSLAEAAAGPSEIVDREKEEAEDSEEETAEEEDAENSDDDTGAERKEPPLRCSLIVSFPADYPDSAPPQLRLRGLVRRIGPERKAAIVRRLEEVGTENLGMASTFTIVSELQEQLGSVLTNMAAEEAAAAEAARQAEEEEEMRRFQGTIVTRESFAAWRAAFNEEMGLARRKREEEAAKAKRRPTGREQFLRDATLSMSDLKLMEAKEVEAEEEEVEVDESLFEDLDDLDLEER